MCFRQRERERILVHISNDKVSLVSTYNTVTRIPSVSSLPYILTIFLILFSHSLPEFFRLSILEFSLSLFSNSLSLSLSFRYQKSLLSFGLLGSVWEKHETEGREGRKSCRAFCIGASAQCLSQHFEVREKLVLKDFNNTLAAAVVVEHVLHVL